MIFKVDLIHNLDFYSKEEFNVINDLFNKLNWYGELEPSNGSVILLTKVSHIIENFFIENNILWGNIKLLDTTNGKIIKEILKDVNFNILPILNRENRILNILDNTDHKYIYPSDLLKLYGLMFCKRASYKGNKLYKIFTFDIISS